MYLNIRYYSDALQRHVDFDVFLPTGGQNVTQPDYPAKTKTLFLLHGYTGIGESWGLDQFAYQHNLAMVMPTAENSFYVDSEATGHQYATFVGEELVGYMRRVFSLCHGPEDTFLMGISMGGFGALHTALQYPHIFGKAAGLSSALIIHEVAALKPGECNDIANEAYYRAIFGDLSKIEESDHNPETLIKKLKAAGEKLPEIYLCCGTEDFLYQKNADFHQFLVSENVPHEYHESPGIHDDIFWNEYKPKALAWLMNED